MIPDAAFQPSLFAAGRAPYQVMLKLNDQAWSGLW